MGTDRTDRTDRIDLIRSRRLDPKVRAEMKARRNADLDRLRHVERALAALAIEHRRVRDEIAEVDDALWGGTRWSKGRRPGTNTIDDALPPLPEKPHWLWGRRLRSVCLRLLERCGAIPLRQLHALLHLHGFGVAGEHPVKALADALGHEADAGNATRVERGRYGLAPGYRPRPSRPGFLAAVLLTDLDE